MEVTLKFVADTIVKSSQMSISAKYCLQVVFMSFTTKMGKADAYGERQVLQFAAASRTVVSLLALLTALIVTPYDTSSRLEVVSGASSLLSAFANWDGVYFAHIARHGYDYEHVHAFFPLYPMLMRALRYHC